MQTHHIILAVLGAGLLLCALSLALHRRIAHTVQFDSFRTTLEVLKLFAAFVIAALTLWFFDLQKQKREEAESEFGVYKTFVEQISKSTPPQRLSLLECVRSYRDQYRPNSRLDNLLIKFSDITLKDPEVQALLAQPSSSAELQKIRADRNASIANAAAFIADNRLKILIEQLFSDRAQERGAAYEAILKDWASNPEMPKQLIAHARANTTNENGIYNTLVVLAHSRSDALKPNTDMIKTFVADVRDVGPRIEARGKKVLDQLQ